VGQRPRRRHIIRQIKAEKIPAIFLENISDPRLMKRIAAETGAKIGGALYSDALSPSDAQQCQGTFRCACAIGRT
jgi:ABC-type Zn uptake system ZnuABC Zn-binding protein ZnuA